MRPPVVPMLEPITPAPSAHSSSFGGIGRAGRTNGRSEPTPGVNCAVLVVGLAHLVRRVHLRLPRRPVVVEEVGVERRQVRLQPKLPVVDRARVLVHVGRRGRCFLVPQIHRAAGGRRARPAPAAARRRAAAATAPARHAPTRARRSSSRAGRGVFALRNAERRQCQRDCHSGIVAARLGAFFDRARISFKSARALGWHTSVHGVGLMTGAAEPAQDFVCCRAHHLRSEMMPIATSVGISTSGT